MNIPKQLFDAIMKQLVEQINNTPVPIHRDRNYANYIIDDGKIIYKTKENDGKFQNKDIN